MASTRNDPDQDLDWIPRTYEAGPEVALRPRITRRPATLPKQAARARKTQDKHGHIKEHAILEPDAAALARMTPEDQAEHLASIRAVRAGYAAGEAVLSAQLNEQLSLDGVDPDELDPGRPF